MAELVLDIVLGSFLGLINLGSAVFVLVWRRKKFSKGIHCTTVGIIYLVLSFSLGVFLPIGGFTFLDGGQSGTKALITATVISPIMLSVALRTLCFCVFIKDKAVIKRILLRETAIPLDEIGTTILLGVSGGRLEVTVLSEDGKRVIRFNESHLEGNVPDFVETCKQIHHKGN